MKKKKKKQTFDVKEALKESGLFKAYGDAGALGNALKELQEYGTADTPDSKSEIELIRTLIKHQISAMSAVGLVASKAIHHMSVYMRLGDEKAMALWQSFEQSEYFTYIDGFVRYQYPAVRAVRQCKQLLGELRHTVKAVQESSGVGKTGVIQEKKLGELFLSINEHVEEMLMGLGSSSSIEKWREWYAKECKKFLAKGIK